MKRSILCALIVLGAHSAFAGLQVQGEATKPSAAKSKVVKAKKTSPTSKVTVETYPAIEDMTYDDEPVVEIGTKPVQVTSPSVVELDAVSKTKAMEERIALLEKRLGETVQPAAIASPAPAAPVASTQTQPATLKTDTVTTSAVVKSGPAKNTNEKFFPVAPEKREQVVARLKIIAALIRESGRAYDYRAMTTAQLETELKSVRAAAAPNAPGKAAPQESQDPAKTPSDVLKIIFSE